MFYVGLKRLAIPTVGLTSTGNQVPGIGNREFLVFPSETKLEHQVHKIRSLTLLIV